MPYTVSLDELECAGWADLYAAAPADWAAQMGMTVGRLPGAMIFTMKGLPIPLFNRAVVTGEGEATEVLGYLQREANPNFSISLGQNAPEAWSARLLGLKAGEPGPILRRDLKMPVVQSDESIQIESVGTDLAEEFTQVLLDGYGMPPVLRPWNLAMVGRPDWHFYLARDAQGLAVGCAGLYIRGEAAWLAMAASLPSQRGRGAQSALIAARLCEARRQGCRWARAETSEDNVSLRNLVRAGFVRDYQRSCLVSARD